MRRLADPILAIGCFVNVGCDCRAVRAIDLSLSRTTG